MTKIAREDLNNFMEAMSIALMNLRDTKGLRIRVPIDFTLVQRASLSALSLFTPYPVTPMDEEVINIGDLAKVGHLPMTDNFVFRRDPTAQGKTYG